MRYSFCQLSDSDFKSSGLRWDAKGHTIGMTYPDAHSGSQAVKIHWSSETVKNKCIIRNIKADNRKWISVADCSKTAVLSIYF